ncbi:MAG: hypothetical protein ACYTEZ_20185 [Planctomycetota bacterium]|jgi:hypothetical protein
MRSIGIALVVLALAVGFGIPAQAHVKPTAVKTDLRVGTVDANNRVQATGPVIGSVTFKPTKGGGVTVSATVNDSRSKNMTFAVYLVPMTNNPIWPGLIDVLKTNGRGNGKMHATAYPDPDLVSDPTDVPIKLTLRNENDGVYYATILERIALRGYE